MGSHWSTYQLTEYFSAITRSGDVTGAAELAAERATEAADAEIGAVLCPGGPSVGVGLGRTRTTAVFAALTTADETIVIEGLGRFHTAVHELGHGTEGVLVVGRWQTAFEPEERQMLRGMAQVLGLAMRSVRTLAAERGLRQEREREAETRLALLEVLRRREEMLETLLQIQRAVSQRAPLQVVLDAVTRGAADLLAGSCVALILRDPAEPGATMIPSISSEHGRHDPRLLAAAATAIREDQLVVDDGPEQDVAIAAPVHVAGDIAGSLVVTLPDGASRSGEGGDVLAAFAEQASLALADARSTAAVREAYHDALTGLPNRVLFLERVDRALEAPHRDGTGVAVLYIDLDLFKQVNDTLGHDAGDELLRGVADRLREALRAGDMASRLGGDEFAVLLEPVEDLAMATGVATRIITALQRPFPVAGTQVAIRASIGIALSDASHTDAGELIRDADVAMYRAKKSRPGSSTVFEPGMRVALLRRAELAADAQRALDAGDFFLRYQPIVTLPGRRTAGVEALLRWTHPRLGRVSPTTLVALAEESGLIADLGLWVLRESGRQLASWRSAGLRDLTVNVNLSSRQLEDEQLTATVAGIIAGAGIPAGALTLEITETALMHDPRRARRRMHGLKELGVRLALGNFGAGYSSLSHLSDFPIDQVKVDRSFIAATTRDRRGLAITRGLIELCDTLGLQSVAEGVEDADQARALATMPCPLAQGYLFSRPLAPGQVPGFAALNSTQSHTLIPREQHKRPDIDLNEQPA